MTPGWFADIQRRVEELERLADSGAARSREEAELDAMIRDAFRAWLSFGRFTKWLVLGLAKLAAGIAAYEFLLGRLRAWTTGGG